MIRMKTRLAFIARSLACVSLWAGCSLSPASPYPLAPLYNPAPPTRQPDSSIYRSAPGTINLSSVPPATTVQAAQQTFDMRAAAAIFQAAGASLPTNNLDNGEGWQPTLAAKWAYPEYFTDDPQGTNRSDTYNAILSHTAGPEGTDLGSDPHNEYDFCLNYYFPVVYRYYPLMPQNVGEYLINTLMGNATLAGIPGGRSGVGPIVNPWSEFIHIPDVVDVAETENHMLGIETARYLANQLLYQRTQDPNYDNLRNGDPGNGLASVTDWILGNLQGFLINDFQEYNARPYQDFDMSALLNLASYAYDDRVRLGARMVLDYLSAKVAVSSSGLRRAPPFRRRNEVAYYGPTIPNSQFLATPLDNRVNGQPDNQTCFYALLAGNTATFYGTLVSNFSWEMVHAGLSDYRIPPSILDLFVNDSHRRFYQYLHHGAGNGEFGDELYAGSPSYLITAGGHPTGFCNRANIQAGAEVILAALSAYFGGVPEVVLELFLQNVLNGDSADLGSAMPTSFMPANAHFLSDTIQLGEYTTDEARVHMGVAPDFACGDNIYLPDWVKNAPSQVTVGNWTFVNEGGEAGQRGFYLAIYTVDNGSGGRAGLIEAYDTWLHPMYPSAPTFAQFYQAVLAANAANTFQFGNNQLNTYVTQSGTTIQYTVSPLSQILSTSALNPAPSSNQSFAAGTIIQSDHASAVVVISNPALGTSITLDMSDVKHPRRTSETGEVDYAGEEVWVNFNYGANVGDFAQPYRTLAAAAATFNTPTPAKTIKIVSGVEHESITISQPVKLIAVGGPVTIYGQ